jgi:hypothetical protein
MLAEEDSDNTMREKIDILPLQGRSQELMNPARAKPENSNKRVGSKKSDVRKPRKKSKK